MFLKQTRLKNGRTHLAIVASYKDGGRTRQRTVESLGYLDELEEHIEDPVAHFRGVCEEMNEAARRASEPVTIEIHPLERVRVSESPGSRRNVGCAVPLAHYGSLGIEGVLRNHARGRRFSYDPNAVARLLVCERILSPDSKLAAWNSRDRYFFRTDFSDDDVYRCLDFLSECRDPVVSAMNRSIAARGGRDTSNVFYDVTNYYFEVDGEDELRRRGVSKEHRPDPIVQMGLLQDADGIPISYRLFPGNTVDCLTMIPVLSDMKRDLGLGRVVAVADKGLNCSDNIAALVARGDGFVFSQSIRGTKSRRALRDWVISDEGYAASGDGFRIKSRQDIKTVHVTSPEADRETKVDVDVDVKVVAFWSRKHAERARHARETVLAKAREIARSPSCYDAATCYGATRYLKNVTFDRGTGEVVEGQGREIVLDEGLIAEEEACDGYYCIVTSETGMSDGEIVDIYRGLWRIEESFRITKSELEARPVYVWTPDHIEAHFLICYVALTIMRLMQRDLGHEVSAERIARELAALSCSREEDNWWLFDHRTELSDRICGTVGVDLRRRRMRTGEIRGLLKRRSE